MLIGNFLIRNLAINDEESNEAPAKPPKMAVTPIPESPDNEEEQEEGAPEPANNTAEGRSGAHTVGAKQPAANRGGSRKNRRKNKK